jgi:3'-phosphoadenosine 5'-phosphosulfate sulfotransferase (PAPS reductase)/FAD synthetase
MAQTIHCFFSGGRDSAVACYIAKRVADVRNWRFVLVHIDTTISMRLTQQYVRQYAEWLGVELITLRPERTFREYAEKFGMWPSLYPQRFRWCYRELKLKPLIEFLKQNYREGDIVVMGVRKGESKFRDKFYTQTFFARDYGGVKARVWAPLLFVDEPTLLRLIERYGIPKNPVWKYGFSGECLCLAGGPIHNIALILRYFPEERKALLEIDDAIQRSRRSGKTSAPFRLAQAGYGSLREFYQQTVKVQLTLDDFIMPYKSCEGSCML